LEGLFVFKDNCQAQPKLQFKLSLKAELALFSFDPAPNPIHESIFLSISWSIVAKLAYKSQYGSIWKPTSILEANFLGTWKRT